MVYDDHLSRKSLEKDPNWPPKDWLEISEEISKSIDEELSRLTFDLDTWLGYKQNIPNDGRFRPHHHPDVEYPLTDEELKALEEKHILYSPILCPKDWESYSQTLDGEVDKRFWWLGLQMRWVEYGYPRLPTIIWNYKEYFLQIFSNLVYNPFIETWGQPPDDFWVKLSHYLESENEDLVLRGLILVFQSQGKIFPSPSLYIYKDDPDPQSLILPPEFWK